MWRGRGEEGGGKRERERVAHHKGQADWNNRVSFPRRNCASDFDELGWQDNKGCQGGFYLNSDLVVVGSELLIFDLMLVSLVGSEETSTGPCDSEQFRGSWCAAIQALHFPGCSQVSTSLWRPRGVVTSTGTHIQLHCWASGASWPNACRMLQALIVLKWQWRRSYLRCLRIRLLEWQILNNLRTHWRMGCHCPFGTWQEEKAITCAQVKTEKQTRCLGSGFGLISLLGSSRGWLDSWWLSGSAQGDVPQKGNFQECKELRPGFHLLHRSNVMLW